MLFRSHQAEVEKAVVRTAGVLWTDTSLGHRRTSAFDPLIDARAAALMKEVRAAYQQQAMQRNLPSPEPIVTADEREAANLVIETVGATTPAGPGGGGAGAGGQRAPAARSASSRKRRRVADEVLARCRFSSHFRPHVQRDR